MKRRQFLATTGTIGIASTISSAAVVSSTYSSVENSMLMEEFAPKLKSVFDKFVSDVALNCKELGLDKKYESRVAMPAHIISKKSTIGSQNIIYKNKSGGYISLTVTDGVERIKVLDTLKG